MLFHPFFKIKNSSTTKLHSPKFGVVDFKKLTPDAAFDLWYKGFEHLAITPEGAKEYLENLNSTELVQFIKTRTTVEEVLAIAKLKNTKAVKEAAELMLEKLA